MIFFLAIVVNAWYFFYLDLSLTFLLIGGAFCFAIWLIYRRAFIHFDGAAENPIVVLGMTTGGIGMLFALIAIVLMQLSV